MIQEALGIWELENTKHVNGEVLLYGKVIENGLEHHDAPQDSDFGAD